MSFKLIGKVLGKVAKIPSGAWKGYTKAVGKQIDVAKSAGKFFFASTAMKSMLSAMNPFSVILGSLTNIFGVFGSMLSTALIPLITALFDIFFSPAVLSLIEKLTQVIAVLVEALLPPLMEIFEALLPVFEIFIEILIFLTEALLPLIPMLTDIILLFIDIFMLALEPFLEIFKMFMPILVPLLAIFLKVIELAFIPMKVILETLMPIIMFLVEVLGYVYDGILFVVEGFIGLINAIIDALNLIPGVDIEQISVPALAAGGIVTQPTLALIGEAGPERVQPLTGPNASLGGGGGGGMTINVQGMMDSRTLRNLTDRMYIEQQKRDVMGA